MQMKVVCQNLRSRNSYCQTQDLNPRKPHDLAAVRDDARIFSIIIEWLPLSVAASKVTTPSKAPRSQNSADSAVSFGCFLGFWFPFHLRREIK